MPHGASVPLERLWRLTGPWYADRLNEDWRPKTTEVIERMFGEAGLTGAFWRMRKNKNAKAAKVRFLCVLGVL